MADHDRDAGSRGEEEAPRDPTSDTTGDTPTASQHARANAPDEDDEQLRYGQAPRGPGFTMPGYAWEEPRPSGSYRSFFRQKPAQVIGAGLIGLFIGGLLGGTAVAALRDGGHQYETHRIDSWERPGRVLPQEDVCQPLPIRESARCVVVLPPGMREPAVPPESAPPPPQPQPERTSTG
ncbi:hypothetical protein [Nonomuraea sp. NPDC002799]